MSLYMETTKKTVLQTCSEIEQLLADHGVSRIMKNFEDREVSGISFIIGINGVDVPFQLPFRWKSVKKMAENGKTGYKKTAEEDQAKRVAARLVLRWVECQLALVEVGMAEIAEIFMPYILLSEKKTLFEKMKTDQKLNQLLLGSFILFFVAI